MLKKAIVNYRTQANLKKHKPQEMMDFMTSIKFAIIYSDLFENENKLDEITRELKSLGKEVSVMAFCHQPKKSITKSPFFTSLDIKYNGSIKSADLSTFLSDQYDYALCLDESGHFLIDYVFSLIKSKCRVGLNSDEKFRHYDLMIHSANDKASLSSEVIRYLKMIQNNEYQPV